MRRSARINQNNIARSKRTKPDGSACYASGDFYLYFKQNMDELGVPAPKNLFETYDKAVATASALLALTKGLGTKVTIAELAGAGAATDLVIVAGAVGASLYAGMVVGSIFVAAQRSASCGSRISDLFVFLHQNKLDFSGSSIFFTKYPQIYRPELLHRRIWAHSSTSRMIA